MARTRRKVARKDDLLEQSRGGSLKDWLPANWGLALFGVGALIVTAMYIAAWLERPTAVDHTNSQLVDSGRRLYAEHCAACHGKGLEGQSNWKVRLLNGKLPAPPHDASGHTWHHSDQVLFDITKRGPAAYPTDYATDMPAFGGRLSDSEIAAIIGFIKSTWPRDILERQQRINARTAP